jgi:hypothetical protein
MSLVTRGAVLIGIALGASFATLSIDVFASDANQIGFIGTCAIFGGIVCAVTSAGRP